MDWLLAPENPSARYLALTRLLDRAPGDGEAREAQAAIPAWGPARAILDAQWPEGYWIRPGVGYSPKYKATVTNLKSNQQRVLVFSAVDKQVMGSETF